LSRGDIVTGRDCSDADGKRCADGHDRKDRGQIFPSGYLRHRQSLPRCPRVSNTLRLQITRRKPAAANEPLSLAAAAGFEQMPSQNSKYRQGTP
jgi:hypothetical protein